MSDLTYRQIYRISEREPEFPAWLGYEPLISHLQWVKCHSKNEWRLNYYGASHWTPDGPRPTASPGTQGVPPFRTASMMTSEELQELKRAKDAPVQPDSVGLDPNRPRWGECRHTMSTPSSTAARPIPPGRDNTPLRIHRQRCKREVGGAYIDFLEREPIQLIIDICNWYQAGGGSGSHLAEYLGLTPSRDIQHLANVLMCAKESPEVQKMLGELVT